MRAIDGTHKPEIDIDDAESHIKRRGARRLSGREEETMNRRPEALMSADLLLIDGARDLKRAEIIPQSLPRDDGLNYKSGSIRRRSGVPESLLDLFMILARG